MNRVRITEMRWKDSAGKVLEVTDMVCVDRYGVRAIFIDQIGKTRVRTGTMRARDIRAVHKSHGTLLTAGTFATPIDLRS